MLFFTFTTWIQSCALFWSPWDLNFLHGSSNNRDKSSIPFSLCRPLKQVGLLYKLVDWFVDESLDIRILQIVTRTRIQREFGVLQSCFSFWKFMVVTVNLNRLNFPHILTRRFIDTQKLIKEIGETARFYTVVKPNILIFRKTQGV